MMDYLASGIKTIKLDKRYEHFYTIINNATSATIHEIFLLCLSIGFKKDRRKETGTLGTKEFRTSYLTQKDRAFMYSIMIQIDKDNFFTNIVEPSYQKEMEKTLISYANGGSEILIEEVIKDNWIESSELIDSHIKDLDLELAKFIYQELETIPF